MKTMVYERYGPPDVLELKELPTPVPGDGDILIRVCATTVNYGDITARNFRAVTPRHFNMPMPLLLPSKHVFGFTKPKKKVLGSEFSGVVESVGDGVTRFRTGDEVFGYRGMNMGAYAEYLQMPENGIVARKPANMSHEEATALPYGAITALNLLRNVTIRKGGGVLIIGASGSIGSHALQLARHHGADITGVCGPSGVEYVQSLGAGRVIDYTKEDYTADGGPYDLIFDVLGRSSFVRCKHLLTDNGVCLYASFKTKQLIEMLATKITGGKRVICALSSEKTENLDTIRGLAESGALNTIIDRRFTLEQAADAHRYAESGHRRGNVVITVGCRD